jgi:transposase
VELSGKEREALLALTRAGKVAARKLQHAQALLKADQAEGAPAWTDEAIAQAFSLSVRSVGRIRERFVEHGLEDALERRQARRTKPRSLDGAGEAQLIAVACSAPPEGRTRWTLRMLAGRLVELEVVDSIHHDTVGETLKKMNSSPG